VISQKRAVCVAPPHRGNAAGCRAYLDAPRGWSGGTRSALRLRGRRAGFTPPSGPARAVAGQTPPYACGPGERGEAARTAGSENPPYVLGVTLRPERNRASRSPTGRVHRTVTLISVLLSKKIIVSKRVPLTLQNMLHPRTMKEFVANIPKSSNNHAPTQFATCH